MKPDLSLALGSYEVAPDGARAARTRRSRRAACTRSRGSSRASSAPTARTCRCRPPLAARRVLDDAEAYVVTNMLDERHRPRDRRAREAARAAARGQDRARATCRRTRGSPATRPTSRPWSGSATTTASLLGRGRAGRLDGAARVDGLHEARRTSTSRRASSRGPPGVTTVTIDARSGLLPFEGDTETLDDVFLAGTEPTRVAGSADEPDAAAIVDGGEGPDPH